MRTAVWVAIVVATVVPCWAYDGVVSTTGVDQITIKADVSAASGFGVHFSTGIENGYGGWDAECMTTAHPNEVAIHCNDGYLDPNNVQNNFHFHIGPPQHIKEVIFKITRRGVDVEVTNYSENVSTSEKHIFYGMWQVPLRESTGFWRPGTSLIYYQANCVLAGCWRYGSGYVISSVEAN